MSLSRGHVDSTDVVISKSDPISIASTPLQIIDGTVSGLSLQLPWMNPRTAKFSVSVKSVHIRLAEVPFPNSQDLVFRALGDEILRSKFRNVAEAERHQARSGSNIRNFLSQVLGRIELLVQDVAVVIDFADGYVGTLAIAKLRARRSETEELRPGSSPALLVVIEGVSVTMYNSANESELPLSIPEFSATLRMSLGENNLEADLDISKILQVFIHSSLREWLQDLRLRQRKWILAHKCDRPKCSAREDGTAWIRYAFRRVSAHRGLRRVRVNFDNVQRAFSRFAEYKKLHVKRLHKLKLNPEEINRIAALEVIFDAEMILLLRQAGKREVDADEISRFGTSEWLRWILFGHNISYEREKLAADLTQSLEASSENDAEEKKNCREGAQSQLANERYAFHFRLCGLATYISSRNHDMSIALTGLGFTVETKSDDVQFDANLSLQGLVCSIDGDIAVQKINPTQTEHSTGGTLLDVALRSKSNELSALVELHSFVVVLHPGLLSSCVPIFRGWTTPLASLGYDHEDQNQYSSRDLQSLLANLCVQNITFIGRDMYVLVSGNCGNHNFKNPEAMATLKQLEIRSVSRTTSLIPELAASMSLRLHQVNASSAMTDCFDGAADFSPEEPREMVLSLSTDFRVSWTPVLTVDIAHADGFVHVPMTRLCYDLYLSIASQITTVIPRQDENDMRPGAESDLEFSSSQKYLTQSGLHLRVSSLNIDMKRDEVLSNDTVTLRFGRLETCFSPTSFSLVSLRVESIRLSSCGIMPILLQIDPTTGFQHALRLKRDFRSSLQGDFYELLIGDIYSCLSPQAILAVVDLLLDMKSVTQSASKKALAPENLQPDKRNPETLLSLFATSLRIRWSDVRVQAEISCFDIQTTAEASRISGSVESVALNEVDPKCETFSGDEIIVHVKDDARKSYAPIRFLYEESGSHVHLSNLSGSTRRSFWEPLVLSITDVWEKIEAQVSPLHQKKSALRFSHAASEESPVTIEGSELTVFFPHTGSNKESLVYADIHHAILCLQSDLQRISLRRTSVLLKNSSQTSGVKGARILSTAQCEITHKTKLPDNEPESSYLFSEVWDFDAPVEFAIALSARSICALRNAVHSLLTPVQWEEPSSIGTGSADLVQDTAIDGRFEFLFRCSVPLLRVVLGTKGLDPNFNPFVTTVAEGLSLSIADVRVGNSQRGFEIIVFTLLASVRTLNVSHNGRGSPDSLRIVIGGERSRYAPQNLSSQLGKGMSVRILSREDHGMHAAQYNVIVSNVSAMHDSKMYENISQFVNDCLHLMNASLDDKSHSYGYKDEKAGYPYGSDQETPGLQGKPHGLASSATYNERSPPLSEAPAVKVAIIISNFTYIYSIDHSRGSTLVAFLRIRKANGALVVSNIARQEMKSSIRLDGVACFVEDILQDVTGMDASFEHRTSMQLSGLDMDSMRLPMLLAPSIVVRAMSHSAQKLIVNARSISVTFSNFRRNQLVVSVGSLSAGASIENLIHLCEVFSGFDHLLSNHSGSQSSSTTAEGLAFRLQVQDASAKLCLKTIPAAMRKKTTIETNIRVSVKYVSDDFFKTSEGFVKVSLDVTDISTGHCDTLVSPCKISYRIAVLKDWSVEAKTEHLLRMSLSPVTMRMFSALDLALRDCTLIRPAPDTLQSFPARTSRITIQAHGIAVRCLSDTPRIQVLRLLIGETTFTLAFNESQERRYFLVNIRDYVLEDTISWRLFRDDENDSTSRRWERILSSMRQLDHCPVACRQGSARLLQNEKSYLDNIVPSIAPREFPLHPALHCEVSWVRGFEDVKGLLSVSGVDLNLDLAAVPIIEEWYNSLLREIPTGESSRSQYEDGELADLVPRNQHMCWVSEVRIEPLVITGSIRATPRRLQQSILERILTGIFDAETVTGVSLYLPSVYFRGEHADLKTILHKVLSEYSHSAMSRHFLSGVLAQSGKLARLARILVMSLFRRRPYNPLQLSKEKPSSQSTSGLLGVLGSAEIANNPGAESSGFRRPLVIHRVDWSLGVGVLGSGSRPDFSLNVLDLT